ncbi:MAG: hypothetical protein ACR2G5_10710 [Pyrinomonadaceae bacterium]
MRHSANGYRRQRAVRLLAVTAALVITHGVARAQQITPSTMLTAGQPARITFETITLTDSQFLKWEKAGTKATIWGDLRFPQRLRGRVPAVVLVHGTGGVGPREERWAEELNSLGASPRSSWIASGGAASSNRSSQAWFRVRWPSSSIPIAP